MPLLNAKLNASQLATDVVIGPTPGQEGTTYVFLLANGETHFQNPDGTSLDSHGNPVAPITLFLAPTYRIHYLTSEGKIAAEQNGTPDGKVDVFNFDTRTGGQLSDPNDPFSAIINKSAAVLHMDEPANNSQHPTFEYSASGFYEDGPFGVFSFFHRLADGGFQSESTIWDYTSDGHLTSFQHITLDFNATGFPTGTRSETYTFFNPRSPELQQEYAADIGKLIQKDVSFQDGSRLEEHYRFDGTLQLSEAFALYEGKEYLSHYLSTTPSGRVLEAFYDAPRNTSIISATNKGILAPAVTLHLDINDLIGKPLQVITHDGGSVITHDGGSVITHDGGSVITHDGGSVITHDGGSVITHDGGSLTSPMQLKAALPGALQAAVITHDGGSVITHDGGSVITHDGGSVITHDGGSVIAKGAYSIMSVDDSFVPEVGGLAHVLSNYAAAQGGVGVLHAALEDDAVAAAVGARNARILSAGSIKEFALAGAAPDLHLGETSIPDLVALYEFDDPSNIGLDSSGRDANLVGTGGASYTAGGKFGGALHLDGTGFLSTLDGQVPGATPLGNQDYTISAWVKLPVGPTFTENFDDQPRGFSRTTLNNWVVTQGNVDVLGLEQGDYVPGNGYYLDLAGNQYASLASKVTYEAGTYHLEFTVAGPHVNNASDSVRVSFGSYQEDFALATNDVRHVSRDVTLTAASTLNFKDLELSGSRDIGAILLDVSLQGSGATNAAILGWGDFGSTDGTNVLKASNSGVVNAWAGNDLSASANLGGTAYHNVTATYDGTTRKIFVDGQLKSSDTPGAAAVGLASGDDHFAIGRGDPALNEFFNGDLDNVAIYSRALAASEIGQIVQGRFVEPATGGTVGTTNLGFVVLQTLDSESRSGNSFFETPFALVSGNAFVVASNPDPATGGLALRKVTLGGDTIAVSGASASGSSLDPLAVVTTADARFFVAGEDAAGRVAYNVFSADLHALGGDRQVFDSAHSPGASFSDAFLRSGGGLAVTGVVGDDVRGRFANATGVPTTANDFVVSDGVAGGQFSAAGVSLSNGKIAVIYDDTGPALSGSIPNGSLSLLNPDGTLAASNTLALVGYERANTAPPSITALAFSDQLVVGYRASDIVDGASHSVFRIQRFAADDLQKIGSFTQLPAIYDYTAEPVVRATADGGFLVGGVSATAANGQPSNIHIDLFQYDAAGALVAASVLPNTFSGGVPTINDITTAPDGEILIHITGPHSGTSTTSEIWSVILAAPNDTVRYADANGEEIVVEGQLDPQGEDWIVGKEGNDTLIGSDRASHLFGGAGNDLLRGNGGNDIIYGGRGVDTARMSNKFQDYDITRNIGLDGVQRVTLDHVRFSGTVDDGRDLLIGVETIEFQDSRLDLTSPVMTLTLGSHVPNVTLPDALSLDVVGNEDSNWIIGNSAANRIAAGGGADLLTGGLGDDRFVFAPGGNADTISDFVAGAASDDKIDLTAFTHIHTLDDVLSRASTTGVNGADTLIDFGNGDSIRLTAVSKASLRLDDFVLNPSETFTDPTTGTSSTTTYDVNGAQPWASQTHNFDNQGHQTSATVTYDDGSVQGATFDTTGQSWTSQNSAANAVGQLTNMSVIYDDNSQQTAIFDTTGQSWKSQNAIYDSLGRQTILGVIYDDGTVQTAVFDAAGDQLWKSQNAIYDALGRQTTLGVIYDDGHTEAAVFDAAEDQSWTSQSSVYDPSGQLIALSVQYDDGHVDNWHI